MHVGRALQGGRRPRAQTGWIVEFELLFSIPDMQLPTPPPPSCSWGQQGQGPVAGQRPSVLPSLTCHPASTSESPCQGCIRCELVPGPVLGLAGRWRPWPGCKARWCLSVHGRPRALPAGPWPRRGPRPLLHQGRQSSCLSVWASGWDQAAELRARRLAWAPLVGVCSAQARRACGHRWEAGWPKVGAVAGRARGRLLRGSFRLSGVLCAVCP